MRTVALIFILTIAANARAEEVQDGTSPVPPRLEEEVTVTASPVVAGTRVEPLAGPVTSVGRSQIEDLSAQDIASALRRVPGVVISRYNPVGSFGGGDGGGIFIRGMGTGRPGAEIATLVDGVPKFVGVWTHPLLDTLSVDLLERVDVYRSAQPVLFGNMSFAGINLVPRHRTTVGFGGRVSAAYGSFGTSALTADTDGKHGRLDYTVAVSQRRSDGQREDASGQTRAIFARAAVDLGKGWETSLLLDGTSGRTEDPGVVGEARPAVTPRFDVSDALGILTLSRRHGARTGFVKLSVDDGSIDWRQWNASSGEAFQTLTDWRNWGMKAQDTFGVPGGGALTAGLELQSYGGHSREEHPDSTKPLGDFRFQNRSLYAAWTATFGKAARVTPSAGIRLGDSREFGAHWGGQAGLSVVSGFGEAYIRYARATNLPGVWTAVLYRGFGRGDEWRELEPEGTEHLELGFVRALGEIARLEATLFRAEVSDALRLVPPPPSPPSFANLGDYRAEGIELTITLEPVRGLSVMAGGTVTRTRPDPVPFTPKGTFVSGAVFARGRWRVSADTQYVGSRFVGNLRYPGSPQEVDAYFLLNGRASFRLTRRTEGPEIFLASENIADLDYAFRPGYPMPGRSLLSGLTWKY